MNSIRTFEELYIKGSEVIGDDPTENLPVYQDLDKLWKFIENHPKSSEMKYGLSSKRKCVVIPYESFIDKRRPPDGKSRNGKPVIFACVGYDTYVSLIIDEMNNSRMLPTMKDEKILVKWKLVRLGKVVDLGWEAFVKQYMEPLMDKTKFEAYMQGLTKK